MKKDKQIPESYLDDAHIIDIDLDPVIFDTPEEGGTWWVVSDGSEPLMYACAKGDHKIFEYCCDYGGENWHLPIDEIYIQEADEYDMEFINDALAKEQMVEDLERNEDTVECKECFDLFPKADCIKKPFGYLCPSCQKMHPVAEPPVDNKTITFDLFDQEFPDVQDYDPGTTKDWSEEPTINDALDVLVADEVEAVDGYTKVIDALENGELEVENADKLQATLDHIKEEEEEHIDELKDFLDIDDKEYAEDEDADKDEDDSAEDEEDPEALAEAIKSEFDEIMKLSKEIGIETGADANRFVKDEVSGDDTVLKRLRSYRAELGDDFKVEENLTEESREGKKLWLCMFEDREVGEVWASDEDEAAELMMKEYPEYPYGLYDGCFHVCLADEDDLDETVDPEVENEVLRESYARALSIAKQSGVSHIFGYTSNLTEEFVALDDPMMVDDLAALEDDLALAYEDFGKSVVVDPEDPEILTEANWLANLWTKENKNLDSIFVQGYLVVVADTETVYEAKSFADAEKIADKASKAYKNANIHIFGKALPAETYNSYAEPIQKVIAAADKNTVVATYKSGKVILNKAPDINKTIKASKSLLKAVEKGSSDVAAKAALEKEAEELAANLEQPNTGKAKVTEPAVAAAITATADTKNTDDTADSADDEAEVEIDTTPVTTEDYDTADLLFKNGFLCFPSKNGKFVNLGTDSKAAAETLIKRSKLTTENQKKVFHLIAQIPTPDSFEKNGESICKELAGLAKGLKLPKELAGYANKIYVLASYQNTKRLQAKGQDLLERIKLKAEMFKELMAEDAEDLDSEADILTTNEADALAEAKAKVTKDINDIVNNWTENSKDEYTEESWSAFATLVSETKEAIEKATSIKALKPYNGLEKLKKLLGKPLVKKPAEEAGEEETPGEEETSVEGTSTEETTPKNNAFQNLVGGLKKLFGKNGAKAVAKSLSDEQILTIITAGTSTNIKDPEKKRKAIERVRTALAGTAAESLTAEAVTKMLHEAIKF